MACRYPEVYEYGHLFLKDETDKEKEAEKVKAVTTTAMAAQLLSKYLVCLRRVQMALLV